MIEIVKEGGSAVYKREIPKNVRQIGEVKGNTKIYMEDYIITFMKQISTRDDKPKAMILYGDRQSDGDTTLMFVHGAVLAECHEEPQERMTIFKEDAWKDVNQKAGHFFKESSVLGWIYLRYDLSDFVASPVINTHKQFFREDQQIYMEYSVSERMENLYLFQEGSMQLQSGYFVYYEQNEAMQNYMITVKQDEPEEIKPEVDKATKKFRNIVQEKKDEISRRQTMGMLYGTSVAMLLIVTIVGVTMLNNYEKMQNMEKVLYDISAQIVDEETGAGLDTGKVEVVTEDAALVDAITQTPVEESGPLSIRDENDDWASETLNSEPLQEMVSDNAVPTSSLLALGAEPGGSQPESVPIPIEESSVDPIIESQENITVPGIYCIEKGDTLGKISNKFYGNENMVDKICEVNGIENKNNIQYGVNIVLP